ncbi:hypothetical protein BC829DRAFT_429793 [Chytridium lagenaria]|nr:hypothetical protein BC829DRAFT_429793 [Chytridium lagenaria]
MSIVTSNRIASAVAPLGFALAFPVLALASIYLNFMKARGPVFNAKGKVIVITGASSGIGESLAKLYAKQGGILILVARRKEQLAAVAAECSKLGAEQVVMEIADVSVEAQVKEFVERTGKRFGLIDMIVLNAGISMGATLSSMENISIIKRIMDVNFDGSVAGALYALPFLRKSTSRGKIVVVSSILGFLGGPTRTGYCASKFALKGFFDSLRTEEPGLDITIVYPGVVKTEINRTRLGNDVEELDMKDGMTSDDAAKIIISAVERGIQDEVYTLAAKFGWFVKDMFPSVRDYLMNKSLKSMSKKRV